MEEYHRQLEQAQAENPKANKSEVAKTMMLHGIQSPQGAAQGDGYDSTALENQLSELRAKVADLQQSFREVHDRSQKLRDDLATVTVVLLTQAAGWSEELAVAWIQENLQEKAKG